MMLGVLVRVSLGLLRRHPWQVGLAVVGVALGVAVVVAVDLAVAAAQRSIAHAVERATGSATHSVIGPSGVPDGLVADLRRAFPDAAPAPRVQGFVRAGTRTLEMIGIDPLAGRSGDLRGVAGDQWRALMAMPGAVIAAPELAAAQGLAPGDACPVRVAGRPVTLRLAGTAEGLPRDWLVADVATAQEVLGRVGWLDAIDLRLEPGAEDALRAALPGALALQGASQRRASAQGLIDAFVLNLRSLALVALLVGAFLIYNTMRFLVAERRPVLAALRALGVTQAGVLAHTAAEAAAIGLAGVLLGLLGGTALGHGLVALVARTVQELYFHYTVAPPPLPATAWLRAGALGLLVALAAALLPAFTAARTPPVAAARRAHWETRALPSLARAARVGALMLLAGAALLLFAPDSPDWTFAGLLTVLGGAAACVPALAGGLLGTLAHFAPERITVRLALWGALRSLERTAVAVAALAVAVAATIGMGVMVDSFRQTVVDWLEYHLRATVYVGLPDRIANTRSAALDPRWIPALQARPEVAAISSYREIDLHAGPGPLTLGALALAPESRRGYRFRETATEDVWTAFSAGEVLVSEPLAVHRGLRAGKTIDLPTNRGWRAFRIAGVYYDYGNDRGLVLMDLGNFLRHYADPGPGALGLYPADGIDARTLAEAARAIGIEQEVIVRSNADLRAASLRVFDNTFAITRVLRLLALGVAAVGVFAALLVIALTRAREYALLRASGVTRAGTAALVLGETGVLGAVAGVLALPIGAGLAWLLVSVVNYRSFGWSIDLHWSPAYALHALALSVAAALLAGLYPAWHVARGRPADLLREE